MFEGAYTDPLYHEKRIMHDTVSPQETSGIIEGTEAFFRYSLRSSDYPTLVIAEPIIDETGNVIPIGHYELALTDERDLLILIESKVARAIIPVIQIEEDASEEDRQEDIKKQTTIEDRQREMINKKRAAVEMTPDEPQTFMEASIEYVKDGEYYLVKYQNGTIRAWGAFKG
ncbi:MAG: hypothetical protein R3Y28_03470 [Candidatus Gastranaerophilales bacterium]